MSLIPADSSLRQPAFSPPRCPRRGSPIASLPGLLLAIVLVSVLATPARAVWPFDGLFRRPPLEERATKLLSEAIRTRTVNPPGNERGLARKLAAHLRRAGIEHEVIPTPGPEDGPARAAVWGRLRARATGSDQDGAGARPALILLSHLDTVPALPSEWSVDPFAGRVWDSFVWGRGALDAKGVTVAHLLTLIAFAESDEKPDRDLIFLATPDEETGGELGAGWIVRHHPELFEGAGYLLTEGGGIQPASDIEGGRPPVWGVTLTEKAPCWLELRAHGQAGHSSTPTRDAAVPRLIAALDRIRRAESAIHVTDEVGRMFAALAPLAPEWDRAGFADLSRALREDDAFRRRFLDNPGQNALVRNTVSITVLEGAPKTNIAPAVARAQLDARLLPGESCEEFAASIARLVDDDAIEIEQILAFPARASSADTPLYRAIERVAGSRSPAGLVVPRMIGGFTDAHWFRELGIVAYGFVPRALPRQEGRRVHGIDERVSIATLVESIELSRRIVLALDAVEREEAKRGD